MKNYYKKPVLLMLAIFVGASLSAQPTLTSSANTPSIGNSFTFHSYDASSFNPGSSGANVTWDFSSVSSTGSSTSTYINPSSGNNSGDFPTATIAISNQDMSEIYYKADNDEFSYAGLITANEITFDRYTNEREILKYPITYQDVFNETFSGTHENTQTSMTYNRSGQITIEADGYGTLITPFNTFNNILRVKITTHYTDSLGSSQVAEYEERTYLWYGDNVATHYFSYVEFEFISFSQTTYAGNYLDPTSVSTENDRNKKVGLTTFPNPATNSTTVIYNTTKAQEVSIVLTNLMGQEILRQTNKHSAAGIQSQQLDLSNFAKGTYLIRLTKGEEVITKKIVVQ